MRNSRTSDWAWKAAPIAAVLLIAALHALTTSSGQSQLLTKLYYLPVAFASVRYGWRWGLLTTGAAAVVLLLQQGGSSYGDLVVSATLALLIGTFTDGERREKQQHQQLAEQLSDVYEKLQNNFEGMKRTERLSAIGHLSAGLAHEIRNPLASIEGAASILRRAQPLEPKALRCVDIIQSESKRLNGLLTTFLNFAGPRAPQLQAVRIDSILDGVIELAQHAIGGKSITFRRRIDPELPPIECDPEQMTQVLLNLLINATEASEAGAAVDLTAERLPETLRIRVIDEGCGVPPEDIDKLFNPFFTTKKTGTGLGLPVAHQIVSQMGGLLTAHRNPSRGMTFAIEFPRKGVRKDL